MISFGFVVLTFAILIYLPTTQIPFVTDNNYFILFNNEKNVKFENPYFKKGKLISISIKKER